MRTAGIALNAALLVFSAIWLTGHSTVRLFDWEFWFAALFTAAAAANLTLWIRRPGAAAGG